MSDDFMKAYPIAAHEIKGFALMSMSGGGMIGFAVGLGIATNWYIAIPVAALGALMIGGCIAALRHVISRTTFDDLP